MTFARPSPAPRAAVLRALRRSGAFGVGVAAVLAASCGAQAATGSGKSFFYASEAACRASRHFDRMQCAIAFANAAAEMRARAPRYANGVDCKIQFSVCEREAGAGYAPAMLGIEIVDSAGGLAVPTLATQAPNGLFRPRSIRRIEPPPLSETGLPQSAGAPAPAWRAEAESAPEPPPAVDEAASKEAASKESPSARRERLRKAPFVQ